MSKSLIALGAVLLALVSQPAAAGPGADALKALNTDGDTTFEIPEVIDLATKVYAAINPDGDTTLEPDETAGRLSDADWAAVNKDGDQTLEMDEWLSIARTRYGAADADGDGKLSEAELDSEAGAAVIRMIVP
jgi:hypothetical protein